MMKASVVLFLCFVLCNVATEGAFAQSKRAVYEVPFASKGNVIALEIANTAPRRIEDLSIEQSVPAWVHVRDGAVTVSVDGNASSIARIAFDVAEDAPVGADAVLALELKSGGQSIGRKAISISVSAPSAVELRAPYPNPFVATSTVEFLLPEQSVVRLAVFDILGRRVRDLVDEELSAGFHSRRLNADALAAGVYFIRMDVVSDASRTTETQQVVVAR